MKAEDREAALEGSPTHSALHGSARTQPVLDASGVPPTCPASDGAMDPDLVNDIAMMEANHAAIREIANSHLVRSIWQSMPYPTWLLSSDGTIICMSESAARDFSNLAVGACLFAAMSCDAMKAPIADWLSGKQSPQDFERQLTLQCGDCLKEGRLRLERVHGIHSSPTSVATFIATERRIMLQNYPSHSSVINECDQICNSLGQAHIDYLQTMGHELRTPLNAVIGLSELVQMHMKGAYPVDESTLSAWIDQINASGRHLHGLIEDLLNKEALEANELPLHIESCDLHETVSKAIGLVDNKFRLLDIRLVLEALPASAVALADQRRAVQVLVNLLDNAAKYSHAGKLVWLSAQIADQCIRISVRDEGPGLTNDQQRGLFRMYSRLGAESTGIAGSGIGLSTSKRLVERMGGVLVCDSVAGTGSNFWFTLPLQSS